MADGGGSAPADLGEPRVFAAIDIGTNSIHLLVGQVAADGELTVLTSEKETVRLGEGPGDIRKLEGAAIDRGIAALSRFVTIATSFGADIAAVATSAVREADNGFEFVERARAEIGIDVDVISGPEEARLIHLGILQALPVFDRRSLIVDIGGGSTEFLVGESGNTLAARSVKLGHLRLTNRFFRHGEIRGNSIEACRRYVRAYLAPVVSAMGHLGFDVAVGSSGTANAIGSMLRFRRTGDAGTPGLDLRIGDRGLDLLVAELVRWPDPEERADHVDALSERRSDVIVAGAILLQEIFSAFGIEEMITSPFALREGVLLDRTHGLAGGETRLGDLRRESLLAMADAYNEDLSHIQHGTDLALALFDGLEPLHRFGATDRDLLEAAGLLHNVGLFVSHGSHHHHSEYIIRNSDRLVGYTEHEIEIIAQVARYHRKSAPKPTHERFVALTGRDRERVRWLAGMLRVAIALDRTRCGAVSDVSVDFDDQAIRIGCELGPGAEAAVEVYLANERSSLLASTATRLVFVTAEGGL